jgi:hypothetical protein
MHVDGGICAIRHLFCMFCPSLGGTEAERDWYSSPSILLLAHVSPCTFSCPNVQMDKKRKMRGDHLGVRGNEGSTDATEQYCARWEQFMT